MFRNNELEQNKQENETKIEQLNAKIIQLENEKQIQLTELTNLKEEHKKLLTELEQLQIQLEQLQIQLSNSEDSNKNLTLEKEQLNLKLSDKEQEINELKNQLNQTEQNYLNIVEENEKLKKELQKAKEDLVYGDDIYYFIEKPKKEKTIINNVDLTINIKNKKIDKFSEYLLNNPRI